MLEDTQKKLRAITAGIFGVRVVVEQMFLSTVLSKASTNKNCLKQVSY